MQKYKKQTLNSSKGEFERGVSEESLILSHLGRVDEKPSAIVPPLAITGAVLIPQSTSLANIATRKASKSFRGTANDIESEEESGEKQEGSPPKVNERFTCSDRLLVLRLTLLCLLIC